MIKLRNEDNENRDNLTEEMCYIALKEHCGLGREIDDEEKVFDGGGLSWKFLWAAR